MLASLAAALAGLALPLSCPPPTSNSLSHACGIRGTFADKTRAHAKDMSLVFEPTSSRMLFSGSRR